MNNARRCDFCNIDVHRESYVKHLRTKKHLENLKQEDLIITEWIIQRPFEE